MKIITVAGIRPDFIRLSEIIKRLDTADCEHILLHTGQHFDDELSGVFFRDLDIRSPDWNLNGAGGNHANQVCEMVPKMLHYLSRSVDKREPHKIVFLGDSNSVMIAPFLKKEGYTIAHIEALMRSGDMRMLEEVNRICCDSVSDLLLTYHEDYLPYGDKLFGEKVVTGNTILEPTSKYMPKVPPTGKHILVDIHRPENFLDEERMVKLFRMLRSLANKEEVLLLAFGRTMNAIHRYGISLGKIQTVPLMGYRAHLEIQDTSKFIISDSGTDQEQACLLGVPVFVPRDFTERPQSVYNHCSVMLDVKNLAEDAYETFYGMAHLMSQRMRSNWLYPPASRMKKPSQIIVESLLSDKKEKDPA